MDRRKNIYGALQYVMRRKLKYQHEQTTWLSKTSNDSHFTLPWDFPPWDFPTWGASTKTT